MMAFLHDFTGDGEIVVKILLIKPCIFSNNDDERLENLYALLRGVRKHVIQTGTWEIYITENPMKPYIIYFFKSFTFCIKKTLRCILMTINSWYWPSSDRFNRNECSNQKVYIGSWCDVSCLFYKFSNIMYTCIVVLLSRCLLYKMPVVLSLQVCYEYEKNLFD